MNYNTDLSDEEIAQVGEDAIAHFGMKGMRWGVRKKRDDGGDGSSSGEMQPYYEVRQKREVGKTTAKVVGGTVAAAAVLAIGAAAATVILSKHGGSNYAQVLQAGYKPPKMRIPRPNIKIPKIKIPKRMPKWETVSEGATTLKKGQKYATYTMESMGGKPMSDIMGTALVRAG